MTSQASSKPAGRQVGCLYELRVGCHLDGRWSRWFDGLTVTNLERGEAVLAGRLPDQAALHGVLMRIRDLGIPLLRVEQLPEAKRL